MNKPLMLLVISEMLLMISNTLSPPSFTSNVTILQYIWKSIAILYKCTYMYKMMHCINVTFDISLAEGILLSFSITRKFDRVHIIHEHISCTVDTDTHLQVLVHSPVKQTDSGSAQTPPVSGACQQQCERATLSMHAHIHYGCDSVPKWPARFEASKGIETYIVWFHGFFPVLPTSVTDREEQTSH